MAARRRSRTRTRTRGRPSRSRRADPNTGAIIGVLVLATAVLIGISSLTGGGDQLETAAPSPGVAAAEPGPGSSWSESASASKFLEEPDEAAPRLDASVIRDAEELYQKAKELHDDARRAQAVDNAKFSQLINDSWDSLLALDASLEKYTDWLEQADMEDWRVPGSYSSLQRCITKIDRLKGRVHRVKPMRR